MIGENESENGIGWAIQQTRQHLKPLPETRIRREGGEGEVVIPSMHESNRKVQNEQAKGGFRGVGTKVLPGYAEEGGGEGVRD